MPRTIRTITTAIAIAALAAPTALARPADMPPAVAKAAAAEQHTQAKSSADTNGFTTRPVIDRPSAPPTARPDITPKPTPAIKPQLVADGGTALTTIAIGIAASLLAIGAIASRTRRSRRVRITA